MDSCMSFDLKQLSLKCQSKKELYSLLATDGNIYLPPIKDTNAGYVRGVVTGTIMVRFLFDFIKLSST